MISFVNDRFVPFEEAGIPVNDLGLQRGYAIFDFLRITAQVPLFLNDHIDRFYRSADLMRLTVPYKRSELVNIIRQLMQKNALPDAGIKLLLTGGTSPDGYQPGISNLIITQQIIPAPPETIFLPGYKLVTYPHQRQIPQVKTTDYIMAVYLQPWLKEKKSDDILYHHNNRISECPRSNFFIVTQSNALVTPAENVLQGITRKQLLSIAAKHAIRVEERDIFLDELKHAKEAFITSSTKRLIPVTQIDDHLFPDFSEHSVTANLYNYFKEWESANIGQYSI